MRRILLALFVLVAVSSPVAAFAQAPTCDCYCTGSTGATSKGAMTSEQCATRCQTDGRENMVTCASKAGDLPGNFPRCFTAQRCAAQGGEFDEAQPRECLRGQHYCYAVTKDNPIRLSVGIGGTTVSDLGDYINRGYNFLLGAAITIAIVMTMVGGVQYAMAGATGDVEAAKHKITNAVMGLLLLFGAYVILYTVNPNLVRLQPPRLPMVKTIVSAGADSCETFKKNGYKVDPANGACGGAVGKLTSGPDGAGVVEGSTCTYRFCPSGMSCFGEGDQAECFACSEVVPQNTKGATPSPALCRSLDLEDDVTPAGNMRVGKYCFHTYDPSLLNFFGVTPAQGTTVGANIGTCAQMDIDCRQIKKCDDYEKVAVKAGTHAVVLDDLEPAGPLNLGGDLDIKDICERNPCRALGQSVDLQRGCVYNDYGNLADECEPK